MYILEVSQSGPLRLAPYLRLADQQTASMDKLYFYILQTDRMLIKWLPDTT